MGTMISDVTKVLVSSTPARVVLATDANDRIDSCFSRYPSNLFDSYPEDLRFWNELTDQVKLLPAIRDVQKIYPMFARLIQSPAGYDPDLARLHEVEYSTNNLRQQLHLFGFPSVRDIPADQLVMGRAIYSWIYDGYSLNRHQVDPNLYFERETNSNLPSGEYIFEVSSYRGIVSDVRLDSNRVDSPLRWHSADCAHDHICYSQLDSKLRVVVSLMKTDYYSKGDEPKVRRDKGKKEKHNISESKASLQNARG